MHIFPNTTNVVGVLKRRLVTPKIHR